jgi:hypothetical protein
MTLDDAVMEMHDIARLVEKEIGTGNLSRDIREVADRLNEVLRMELKYGNNKKD